MCENKTLALGDSAIFYQCHSGNFYNLYDEDIAEQCSPIYLVGAKKEAERDEKSQVCHLLQQLRVRLAILTRIIDS